MFHSRLLQAYIIDPTMYLSVRSICEHERWTVPSLSEYNMIVLGHAGPHARYVQEFLALAGHLPNTLTDQYAE